MAPVRRLLRVIVVLLIVSAAITGGTLAFASPQGTVAGQPMLGDWPEFGLNPQRSDATDDATGITAANVGRLRVRTVTLPGTADDSPIYLHGAEVGGGSHDVVIVATSYGITLAIDANSGRTLWQFTPPGFASFAGSAQITTASPIAVGGFRVRDLAGRADPQALDREWP